MKPLKPWQITTVGRSPGASGRSTRPCKEVAPVLRRKGTVSLMAGDCRLRSMTTLPISTRPLPLAQEYRALREGCGLADLSWLGRLELLGADRLRFLNAYVTCDVKGLAPGEGAYGFFTSPQGRILSDAVVLAHEDRLWVEVGPGQEEPIAAHLKKFLLADRVEVRSLDDMLPITVLGPRAEQVLGADLSSLGELWSHGRIAVHGTEVELQRRGLAGAAAWTLWVSA